MNLVKIPTRSDLPAYTERVVVDGSTYTFEFKYSQRTDLWDVSIYDADGGLLLAGIPLVGFYPLNLRHKIPGLFSGALVVLDSTGQNRTPTRSNLGTELNLFYMTAG